MSLQCQSCGLEYPPETVFHSQPVGKGKFRRVCAACKRKDEEAVLASVLKLMALLAVVGAALIWAQFKLPVGWDLLFFAVVVLSQSLCVIPHELGHALAGLLLGMRVFNVSVGSFGQLLFVWRVFGYDVGFRSIPLGGGTLVTPKSLRLARLRFFVVVLCGPLANVLMIALGLHLTSVYSSNEVVVWMLTAFVWGNIVVLVVNLFPINRRRWRPAVQPNDGMLLLTIPFSRQGAVRQWHSSTFWYEVLEAIERKRLDDAERWLAKGVAAYPDAHWVPWAEAAVLLGREEYRNARAIYVNLLGDSEAEIGSEGLLQNNVAWIDLMIGDPALLAEADQFSEQALAAAPSVASFKGTRGSVLVELGRIDEGVPLLEQALRENEQKQSKALNACYLALVAARCADKTAARRYVDLAKRHDSACPLLGRANRALECQSPDNA